MWIYYRTVLLAVCPPAAAAAAATEVTVNDGADDACKNSIWILKKMGSLMRETTEWDESSMQLKIQKPAQDFLRDWFRSQSRIKLVNP